jgi:hypothetical protein
LIFGLLRDIEDTDPGRYRIPVNGRAPRLRRFRQRLRTRRSIGNLGAVRDFAETRFAAKSWSRPRRVAARVEAARKGRDIRYVVSSIARCVPASLYSGISAPAARPRT